MAELLIRVKDKRNPPEYPNAAVLDTKLLQRGDVVMVCPDGWQWGDAELSNPDWRIVKAPTMTPAEAETYLAAEPEQGASRMTQRRAFHLNLDFASDVASREISAWLMDDTRKQPAITIPVGVIRALRKQKPKIIDPTAIF